MNSVQSEAVVDANGLDAVRAKRTGLVMERLESHDLYVAEDGPFGHYQRQLDVEDLGESRWRVRQHVEFILAIPYFRWLFAIPYTRALARLRQPARTPWWSPPQPLGPEASAALASLALLAILTGYLGTLLTQTVTFAAEEFDSSKSQQGLALAAVRFDFVISVTLAALADRKGRRRLLLVAAAAGCCLTALGALAPGIGALAGTQLLAKGCVTASVILAGIVAAEEMPAGCRAYAVGLLALASGLGAGTCVALLPLADLDERAWRIMYAVPIAALFIVRLAARTLPESQRFRAPHTSAPVAGHGRRLFLLAASAMLLALFITPASQFQNEFLRDERDFSAVSIALFTILTTGPGGIGIVIASRFADVRGRRLVAVAALCVSTVGIAWSYASHGPGLWIGALVGSVFAAATIPALAVYGPELFPTSLRGKANGLIGVAGRLGSVCGLVFTGWIADRHGIGSAFPFLAIGPVLLIVLVITLYPETAHRELEDLNPEDRISN